MAIDSRERSWRITISIRSRWTIFPTYLGFRVEEIDNRDPQQVQPGEQEIRPILQLFEHDRVDQHGPPDADRPAGDTEAVALRAQVGGEDLGRDEEGDGTPGCGLRGPSLAFAREGQEEGGHVRRSS